MNIIKITNKDKNTIFKMMRVFYDSPALIHHSSDKVLLKDIEDCLDENNPFIEGYIFREDDKDIGYAMVSRNYTTEYGGICIWVEDLYLEEGFRNSGRSLQFFSFLEKQYPEAVRYKLEVESDNERAIAAYKKNGYGISEYHLMTKEIEKDFLENYSIGE